MRLRISREATREILSARAWWREHRSAVPDAVTQDLQRAFALLRSSPRAGALVPRTQVAGLRRIHLGRIRFDLYYRVDEEGSAVEVLAFWHSSRGTRPPL